MFREASRIEPLSPGRYRASADDAWLQGRGQYGGLVAAWIVRALEHHVADDARPLRSVTFHLGAPVPAGPVTIEVETVRAGANVTQLAARVLGDDGVAVSALATAAAVRPDGVVHLEGRLPDVPPPDAVPPFPWVPLMPTFAKQVEYRFCVGAPPYSSAARPELGGWGRFVGGATPDRALVAALLDAWPPAVVAALSEPRPMATVDWTVHLLAPPAPEAREDDAWLLRAVCTWADEGYAEVAGELWDEDGRLLGRMRQLVALLPTRRRA